LIGFVLFDPIDVMTPVGTVPRFVECALEDERTRSEVIVKITPVRRGRWPARASTVTSRSSR